MTDTTYYWQGGRKILIQKDPAEITIQVASEAEAQSLGVRAGVDLHTVRCSAPGLVRAAVSEEADAAVDRLRAQSQVVHHVYRDRSQPRGPELLITETFFIKFKPQTPEEAVRRYFAAEGLVVEREMGEKTFVVRVTDATAKNAIRAANSAAERPDVEYAEPNLVRTLKRFFTPPDDLFARQWHLHAPADGNLLVAGAGIFAPEAWDTTLGRRDTVIAVADDGFDLTHPDFQGTGKVVARLNATLRGVGSNVQIQWDENVQPRAGDYHGTPCLGVAAAEGNGTGVIGVAPGCGIAAVRFPLQSMTDAHFIAMFRKISTVADVVSCSWGVGPANAPMSSALKDDMARLASTGGRRGRGLVFCIAAGNNNCPVLDLGNSSEYRFLDESGIGTYDGPIDRWVAAHPDAVTVSASTSRKTRSAYSSWGEQISVCAPSDNWDDLDQVPAPGLGIVTTDNEGAGAGSDFTPGSRFTNRFGGTSSATPTVAGVCGLVLSVNPALTGRQVRDLLRSTADKTMSLVTDTPVNRPGDFVGGVSLWFGHGKVHAARAVAAAAGATAQLRAVDVGAAPGLPIPDVGQAVTSTIQIPPGGRIEDLRLQVDIRHTCIGDLRVDLLAPDGSAVSLHNNTGGTAEDLKRTWSVADKPALRGLFGKPIEGTWQLRVTDSFRLDEGRLVSWRIVARVSLE